MAKAEQEKIRETGQQHPSYMWAPTKDRPKTMLCLLLLFSSPNPRPPCRQTACSRKSTSHCTAHYSAPRQGGICNTFYNKDVFFKDAHLGFLKSWQNYVFLKRRKKSSHAKHTQPPPNGSDAWTVKHTRWQMASGDLLNNRLGCQCPLVSNLCREFGNCCLRLEYFLANTFNHLLGGFLIQNEIAKPSSRSLRRRLVFLVPGSVCVCVCCGGEVMRGREGRFRNSPEPAGSRPAYLSF